MFFFGLRAGNITTGHSNVALGTDALKFNTDRSNLVAIGDSALFNNSNGADPTNHNPNEARYNTAVGSKSLYSNTIGYANTANGMFALYSNTVGTYNTAVGLESLYQNTSGQENTGIGGRALWNNTTGSDNTATGRSALFYNTTGSFNTAIGNAALSGNTTGLYNTATGTGALIRNTTGWSNTAIGYAALYNNTTGYYNTAMGDQSLELTTSSYYNTVIGYKAGALYDMGWNNTILGANCDINAPDLFNCIAIGQDVTCTASSQARIGNLATNSIGGYADWTNFSDGRYKKDVNQNVKGLEFIMKLQPVTYHLDISGIRKKLNENRDKKTDEFTQKAIVEKEKVLFSGFVAQDVEKVAKEAGYDFSGVDKPKNENDFYGLRYAEFVVPLVKAVQEQQAMINELKKQNTDLQNRVTELEKKSGNNNSSLWGTASDVFSVWPNPSHDMFIINIGSNNETQALIKVFDSKGALVKEQQSNILQGNNQISVDLKRFAAGVYHLSTEWNKGQIKKTAQLVKQ
jgi:hypothetical protein